MQQRQKLFLFYFILFYFIFNFINICCFRIFLFVTLLKRLSITN